MKCFLSFLFFVLFVLARTDLQADPAITTLFSRTTSTEDVTKAGLESGRYKSQKSVSYESHSKVVTATTPLKKKRKIVNKRPASESPPTQALMCTPQAPTEPQEQDIIYHEPLASEQIQDLYRGGVNNVLSKYKEQLHSDDIRNNRLEIEIGTGAVYDSAISNLSYKNYYTLAPTLRAGGHVWMTPLLGVSGFYESTFGESVTATTGSSDYTAKSTWTEFSFDVRKFFGASRRANSINYGLILSQYKFEVQNSATSRVGLATTGFGVYLHSRIPVVPNYAWTFGFEVFPILSHSESQTSLNLSSGGSNTSSRIGFSVGGELKFNRSSQIIWTLGAKMERNQFSGQASLADPATGNTPNGVTATNTWTYLNLGYRWGQ